MSADDMHACCLGLLGLAAIHAVTGTVLTIDDDVSEHFDAFKKNGFSSVRKRLELYERAFFPPKNTERLAQVGVLSKMKLTAANDEISGNQDTKGKFEGDIVLLPEQARQLLKRRPKPKADLRVKRRVDLPFVSRWPRPRIPYTFHSTIDEATKPIILAAIEYWEGHTCLSFHLDDHGDHLEFFRGSGCYSVVGRAGGKQGISIGWGCETLGIVAHEVGHAMGFWHEQSRTDRDKFVKINDDNVYPGRAINFMQRPGNDFRDVDYDYGSVMHYGPTAFTLDGEYTIETKNKMYQNTIGQRVALSFLDVKRANQMYCDHSCERNRRTKCQNNGYPHPKDCGRCICPDGFSGMNCQFIRQNSDRSCSGGGSGQISADLEVRSLTVGDLRTGMDCVWQIKSDKGKLHVRLVDANFTCSHTCYGYVEFKYLGKYDQTGARICCKTTLEVSPVNNQVMIIARNHLPQYMPRPRFRIEYWRDPTPQESSSAGPTWGPWSTWRRCSGGIQCRVRRCRGKCLKGNAIEIRQDPSSDYTLFLSSKTAPRCDSRSAHAARCRKLVNKVVEDESGREDWPYPGDEGKSGNQKPVTKATSTSEQEY